METVPKRKHRPSSPSGASARENILAVFTRLGGTAAMAKWAKQNQTEFYRLYARLVPKPVEVSGTEGGAPIGHLIQVQFVEPTDTGKA